MIDYLKSLLFGQAKPGQAKPGQARSSLWPDVRKCWLKDHPTCAACGIAENLEVHHKYPFSWPGGHVQELSEGNLMTLCESKTHNCHLWVGHLGDWKSRNPTADADAANFLQKIKGRPYPKETR